MEKKITIQTPKKPTPGTIKTATKKKKKGWECLERFLWILKCLIELSTDQNMQLFMYNENYGNNNNKKKTHILATPQNSK